MPVLPSQLAPALLKDPPGWASDFQQWHTAVCMCMCVSTHVSTHTVQTHAVQCNYCKVIADQAVPRDVCVCVALLHRPPVALQGIDPVLQILLLPTSTSTATTIE
jgi:hypothetical protein